MPETFKITVNGQVPQGIELDLLELEVDANVHLPTMFSFLMKDELTPSSGTLKYTDASTFALGAEVKIEISTDELWDSNSTVTSTVVIGEITSLEPSFPSGGSPRLRVRGYDRSHRLARGKKTRTYGDANPTGSGINESEMVSKIAQEAGLSSNVDTSGFSSIKYSYVLQYNQSDLEFLWSRARLLGYQVYVDDKKLCFQKADFERGTTAPAELKWGTNLASFTPRLTTIHQTQKATAYGWDVKNQQTIQGDSQADNSKTIPQIGLGKKGSQLAKTAFSDQSAETIVDFPVTTVDHAKALANARLAQAESEVIRADGVCRMGDPRIIAGRMVTISGIGTMFSGKYYVTEARHLYSNGHYTVSFAVTGRTPNTFNYLLGSQESSPAHERVSGVVAAKVVSLSDPEKIGRVQVKFPWLPKYNGAELSSAWARIASPMAGNQFGVYYLPEINDEVLVAFEHGDISHPYIVGMLYNHKTKPPGEADTVVKDGKVNQRIIKSRSGHMIVLDDTQGAEQILVQDKTSKNSILIDSKENTITITSEKNYTLVAKGDASIEAQGNITFKATKDFSIECQNFKVKASANAEIKPTGNLDLKATGNFTAEGMLTAIKGQSMVQVQSSGMVQVKGNPIMLN